MARGIKDGKEILEMQCLQRYSLWNVRPGNLSNMHGKKRLYRSGYSGSKEYYGGLIMNPEDLIKLWKDFTEKNDFNLNPDKEHVDMVAKGVLENEKKHGFKLCPCRLRDGSRQRDLELICPCNFKIQDVWKTKNMCWCGLFIKK
jgi:ferredoxin-thioredoxin reductase catalytic chain